MVYVLSSLRTHRSFQRRHFVPIEKSIEMPMPLALETRAHIDSM